MKIPKAKKLPSGSWFIRLRLGGEEICITEATEKAAIRQATLIKAEHRAGVRQARTKDERTVRQVIDAYIDSRRGVLSPSTINGYAAIARTRFQSIMSLPAANVKDWQKVVSDEAKLCAAKTLKNAWGFLASCLNAAKINVPDVRLPQIVRKDRPWLDYEQVLAFLDAVRGKSFEIPALLGLHGLRRSEIYAMRWSDIDLQKNLLHVRGAVVLGEDQKPVLKDTNKNVSSRRDIPIMIPRLHDLLKNASKDSPSVVQTNLTTLYAQVNTVCRRADLPEVGVHGLRHSFASLCYHVGLGEVETMQLGGWADPGTMRKIYRHLADQDRDKAAERLAAFFAASKNGNENGNERK